MRTQVRGSEVTNTNKKETIEIQESGRLFIGRPLLKLCSNLRKNKEKK
jgi:hypothetical protein